jgi:pyruvate kinase
MLAGMNVARLNFSHGTHEQHARTVASIRGIAEELGRPVAILGDLQGPRIRIGQLAEAIPVTEGTARLRARVARGRRRASRSRTMTSRRTCGPAARSSSMTGCSPSAWTRSDGPRVHVTVRYGGLLKSNKGMNLPGIDVSAPSLTEKDRADIPFAIAQDLDYLALSFVRAPRTSRSCARCSPRGCSSSRRSRRTRRSRGSRHPQGLRRRDGRARRPRRGAAVRGGAAAAEADHRPRNRATAAR